MSQEARLAPHTMASSYSGGGGSTKQEVTPKSHRVVGVFCHDFS
jgi:hypothetical protein